MKTTLALTVALLTLVFAASTQAATLRLSPAKVTPGTIVTAQGAGFAHSSRGRITVAGITVRLLRTNASGEFSTRFRVPRLVRGTPAVGAQFGRTHVSSALIVQRRAAPSSMMAATAGQRMMLAPAAGPSGTMLSVRGWKFARSTRLAIRLDGSLRVGGVQTNRLGSFARRFLVPGAAAGPHNVVARTGRRALASAFAVTSCGPVIVCLPYFLDFSMDHGSQVDKDGTGTGFTTKIGNVNATKLDVTTATGRLAITSTQGLTFTPSNPTTQDNALGVGVNAALPLVVNTVLASPVPAGTGGLEQAGLYLGKDGDNYVKVILQSNSPGAQQIQIFGESAGSSAGNDSRVVSVGTGQNLSLTLRTDTLNRTFTASWAVSGGGSGSMQLTSMPASLFAAGSIAGIFTSYRNGAEQTYSFDSFRVRRGTNAAPPPPGTVGTWTNKASLPVGLLDAGGAAVGGKLYLVAGKTSPTVHVRTLHIYTAGSPGSWTTGADLPASYAGGAGIENVAAAGAGGKLYVFGGQTAAFAGAVTDAAVYDPGTDSWSTLASMSVARGGATAQAIGSKIYVVGGMNATGMSLRTLEVYDIPTDTWTTMKPLSVAPRDNPSSAVLDVGGQPKLFVFGGRTRQSNLPTLSSVEMYDPVTNIWSARASMPTGRRASVAGAIGNKAIVVGGERSSTGSGAFAVAEEYNPATNTWRALRPLPTGRQGAVGGVIGGDTLYYAGGATASPPPGSSFSALNQAFHY